MMTTSLRLLFLSTFLICVLSAAPPKFYLIKTGAEDGQVEEVASGQEESKQENNADYADDGPPTGGRGGGSWNPNDG